MRCLFFLLVVFVSVAVNAQSNFTLSKFNRGADRFWIFEPNTEDKDTNNLIVFLHGYGVSNAKCYGNWIDQLIDQGYTVLFPKYQQGVWFPRAKPYQKRVEAAIDSAANHLKTKGYTISNIHFITHSMGGVLAANIAQQNINKRYTISSLFLTQPGHKRFKLGALNNYNHIESETNLVLVVGEKDKTAGNTFATLLNEKTPQLSHEHKIYLVQRGEKYREQKISSHHKEPLSPNEIYSTRNWNLLIYIANKIGKTNAVDHECFFRLSQELRECSINRTCYRFYKNSLNITDMGSWSDGQKRTPLKIQ